MFDEMLEFEFDVGIVIINLLKDVGLVGLMFDVM